MSRRGTTHCFGLGFPRVTIRVRRVYPWTDWLHEVRHAVRDLWLAFFGCRHDWRTIRFSHFRFERYPREAAHAFVNECSKCGRVESNLSWRKFP